MNPGIVFFGIVAAILGSLWIHDHNGQFTMPRGASWHTILRWTLALWAIAYPIVSCSPLWATGTDSAGASTVGGVTSLVVGAALFGPWIVGVIVLAVLVWVTKG